MRIWLREHNWPWQPEKYRFPVEQMLLTLFPEERPEYPDALPKSPVGERGVLITLSRGEKLTTVSVLVKLEDRFQNGATRFPSEQLDEPEERVYHTVSHAIKQAFYKAGTALLGRELPWGSLTGVRPVKLPTRAMRSGKTAGQAEQELKKEYHVSSERAALAAECARAALDVQKSLSQNGLSLYIGIPFCPTRCAYCSFISSDIKGSLARVEPYVDALCREIELAGNLLRENGLHITTAYMGGGTPTVLTGPQLDRVLSRVERFMPMERRAEFTVEAGRPDTLTADKLKMLRDHGIDRISVNPQTMEDSVLRAIGRDHTAAQIEEAMELAQKHFGGLVNMDLIAGLPTDSRSGFGRTLDRVLAFTPANITVHTLSLKKGSRLTEEGGELPSSGDVEQMLALAGGRLREAGYAPYYLYRQKNISGGFENVGWATPGAVCAYNVVMMEELQTVLSLGAGGISKMVDPDRRNITRLNNPKYAKEYLDRWDKIAADKRKVIEFQAALAQR